MNEVWVYNFFGELVSMLYYLHSMQIVETRVVNTNSIYCFYYNIKEMTIAIHPTVG